MNFINCSAIINRINLSKLVSHKYFINHIEYGCILQVQTYFVYTIKGNKLLKLLSINAIKSNLHDPVSSEQQKKQAWYF